MSLPAHTTATARYFVSCARGMERLLSVELAALGLPAPARHAAGAAFTGDLGHGYRVCLWSRLASRVYLELARFAAPEPDALYHAVRALAWEQHIDAAGTLAVYCAGNQPTIPNMHYAALKVKDAVVDALRAATGTRPSIDREQPDVRLYLHLERGAATLYLDLSGDSLHRRGYRRDGLTAPLKETLAAAVLTLAGWPAIARRGGALVDPLCGSGTLPIEAALIAADIAPGLLRPHFGFLGWRQHDVKLWRALLDEAHTRRATGMAQLPPIWGFDGDAQAVTAAQANVEAAGLFGQVHIEQRVLDTPRLNPLPPGLWVANPPYGVRLPDARGVPSLDAALAAWLTTLGTHWHGAVLSADTDLARRLGGCAGGEHALYNGAIPCRLWCYTPRYAPHSSPPRAASRPSDQAIDFANRIAKNAKRLMRWVQQSDITCYRVYDADLPDYAFAVDFYQAEAPHVVVQEYAAPREVAPDKVERRRRAALAALPTALGVTPAAVHYKERARQRGDAQYQRLGEHGAFHAVREAGCRLWVNFTDYLDTGLFLEQRALRALIGEVAAGRDFLNLYGYTGSATVHAARGGARTTTVDLSRTYLDWAGRNLHLNKIDTAAHRLVQADCRAWLSDARPERYAVILLNPPAFSNSKRMNDVLDLQRDHATLIQSASQLLTPDGILLFATHKRGFRLDTETLADRRITDLSAKLLPPDFARHPHALRCWRIEAGAA